MSGTLRMELLLCFDTMEVNTSKKSGVCHHLEMMLNKPWLYFECCHHIFEILLAVVFSSAFHEQSKGSEINLFLDFRNIWPQIDQTKYSSAKNDESIMLQV